MSTPPPPPSGDATPPPAGNALPAQPAAPAMAPNAQFGAPAAAKSGGAKKIIFILVGVLALGGIGFAGYKYGPDLWAKYMGGGDINTPDGTIKYVLNGLANNKPEVFWEALPAKHQKLIHDEIKKSGANLDPEIQTKTVDVLKKATGVLKNKKTLIIETVQAMSGGQGEGLPPELTDNWDDVVSLLEIVVNSKAMTPEWLKDPDIGAVLKEDGGKLMSSPAFEKLINMGLKEDVGEYAPKDLAEFRKWIKGIKVELVESTETTAKVKLSSVDMKIDAVDSEMDMLKLEDRWLPKEMADGMDQFITELKREMPMGQMLGSDAQMSDQQKAQLLGFLNTVDKALDTINNAADSNELMAAVGQMMGGALGQQLAGLEQAFGGGGGSTGGAGIPGINPGPGIRPGVQPGTNPGTIIPGLAPTGPPKPAGYKTEWSIGGGRFKIDEIYPGKTEAVIKQVFGDPALIQGEFWTYRGLKVRNMKLGGTFTTVLFQMQNGKVARVIVQP